MQLAMTEDGYDNDTWQANMIIKIFIKMSLKNKNLKCYEGPAMSQYSFEWSLYNI